MHCPIITSSKYANIILTLYNIKITVSARLSGSVQQGTYQEFALSPARGWLQTRPPFLFPPETHPASDTTSATSMILWFSLNCIKIVDILSDRYISRFVFLYKEVIKKSHPKDVTLVNSYQNNRFSRPTYKLVPWEVLLNWVGLHFRIWKPKTYECAHPGLAVVTEEVAGAASPVAEPPGTAVDVWR